MILIPGYSVSGVPGLLESPMGLAHVRSRAVSGRERDLVDSVSFTNGLQNLETFENAGFSSGSEILYTRSIRYANTHLPLFGSYQITTLFGCAWKVYFLQKSCSPLQQSG
jgi:hypothetical protein